MMVRLLIFGAAPFRAMVAPVAPRARSALAKRSELPRPVKPATPFAVQLPVVDQLVLAPLPVQPAVPSASTRMLSM